MKQLIVTRADENIAEMTSVTHPVIKSFAAKWKSDFLCLSNPHNADCSGNGKYHYRLMKVFDLLDEYDRVISLDSDILILPSCPNLFDFVSESKIGSVFEDKGTRKADREKRIAGIQDEFGSVGWKSGYINTGVFVVSKKHKEIFQKINGKYWESKGFDDVHFGYQIRKFGFEIQELPYQLNHMTMFSEQWNGSPNRFNSHIIHYAGTGVFDKGMNLMDQIRADYTKIFGQHRQKH